MLQISLVSILVGLLFMKALGEVVMATNSQKTFKSSKELRNEAKIVDETASKWSRGRKISTGHAFKEKKASEKNSAENECAGKCGHGGKRAVCANRESTSKTLPSTDLYLGGFIPFASDYHSPKNHPPKNN